MKEKGAYPAAKLVLLAEALALLIGMVTPIMPSRTGVTRGMAHLFFTEPSYLQQVLVNFLVVNLLMAIIAIIVVAVVRREGGR
jgi:hypothetical protein